MIIEAPQTLLRKPPCAKHDSVAVWQEVRKHHLKRVWPGNTPVALQVVSRCLLRSPLHRHRRTLHVDARNQEFIKSVGVM